MIIENKPPSKSSSLDIEKDLHRSSSHYNKLEKISKTGSFTWNLNDDYLECSPNLFYILSIEKSHNNRLHRSDFFELFEKESPHYILDVMHESIFKNEEFEITFNHNKTGKKKIRLFGYPEGDDHSKVLVATLQDITENVDSSGALLIGQDQERKRISLELHDSVGQKLIAAKYKLALVKMNMNVSDIDELNVDLISIIEEIRAITYNLSSQIVVEVGLKDAIQQLVTNTSSSLNASKEFTFDLRDSTGIEITLSNDSAKMIYRIVQEAMTNSLKYSKANHIDVSIKVINQQVVIKIKDDGKGIADMKEIKKGIGLHNIRERVSYLNGFIRIESEPNKGVLIEIKISIPNATL